jgi:hypothetical protein
VTRRVALSLVWLSGAAFFVLYVVRLCPTLFLTGDSPELVSAAVLWGVPHPPGYPLYTAVAHFFAALPIHSPPWRVHLTSAVFHALTLVVVGTTTYDRTRNVLAAVVSAFALGLSRVFLVGSLYAEVFPLNDLFFACLLGLSLRLEGAERPGGRDVLMLAACLGLSLAHHPMIVLAMPAVGLLAGKPVARWFGEAAPGQRIAAAACLLAPVAIYGLVPLAAARAPALSWGNVHDWASFWRLVTRADYGGLFSPARNVSSEPALSRVLAFGRILGRSWGRGSLLAALVGWLFEMRRRPAAGSALGLAFVVPGPAFAWANALGTRSEAAEAYFERFTSMCHVPLALAIGLGVAYWLSVSPSKPWASWLSPVALAGWAISGWIRSADVDLSRDVRGSAFARDLVLGSPDGALVLVSGDEPASAALYLCDVEHACGSRVVLSPGSLFMPWRMAQVRARYPDLTIPWTSGPALAHTHELAAAALRTRPVLVQSALFEKDPLLLAAFAKEPDRLLYRLWPLSSSLEAERAFVDSARAIAGGNGCGGCSLLDPIRPRPSQDVEIVEAYAAAFFNHATRARSVADAADLAEAFETRSGSFRRLVDDYGGALSRSR